MAILQFLLLIVHSPTTVASLLLNPFLNWFKKAWLGNLARPQANYMSSVLRDPGMFINLKPMSSLGTVLSIWSPSMTLFALLYVKGRLYFTKAHKYIFEIYKKFVSRNVTYSDCKYHIIGKAFDKSIYLQDGRN